LSRDREVTGGDNGFGQSRRDFLRALGGAIGVALASDPSTIGELAEAAAKKGKSKLPSGYVWHRVLADAELDGMGQILPGVMINDRSEIIFHAEPEGGGRAVYRMRIGRGRKPGNQTPQLIVRTGQTLPNGIVVDGIAAGDTNRSGAYVTVIKGKKFLESVWIQWPGSPIQQLVGPTDRIPGPQGRYSGHFGSIDIGDRNEVLLVAAYTLPGAAHHGLFLLPKGRREKGRLLLRSGQRIPDSRAVLTRLGLVERRGDHYIQQVFGRQPKDRANLKLGTEPSGFLVGKIRKGRHRKKLLVGSRLLRPNKKAVKGEAFVGPRIDHQGIAATVVHKRPNRLSLHRHHRGRSARIAHTGNRTRRGERAKTISAPIFGPKGLLYYRAIGDKAMELLVVHGNERRMILETGDKVGGKRLKLINTGWSSDQVDRRGRLAFQVQYADGSTAIVVGTPV
jgi:hypothetical protein